MPGDDDDDTPLRNLVAKADAHVELSPEMPESELGDVEGPQAYAADPPGAIDRAQTTVKAIAFQKLFHNNASNNSYAVEGVRVYIYSRMHGVSVHNNAEKNVQCMHISV